jgi:TetR/AcrR family transcriptional repressor of nem operon
MRVSRHEAAANRERIVEVAGRLFREKGFDGIGVADLMRGAGMTHGGFYGHFGSKEDLAAEACGHALAQAADRWGAIAEAAGDEAFAALARNYLSEARITAPGSGCALAVLGSEAARHGRPLRRVFAAGLEKLVAILTRAAPGAAKAEKRERALAALSQMVGAMVLARSVDDPTLAREILHAATADLTSRQR